MGLFKKKTDPLSARARALNAEISALESKIKKLNQHLHPNAGLRFRSTAFPNGASIRSESPSDSHTPPPSAKTSPPKPSEPVFEHVDQRPLTAEPQKPATPQHFNEMGVRKYNLVALLERARKRFSGPAQANPNLVKLLASGSVEGLRPLRYEQRVARNRFLWLSAILFLAGLGILYMIARHHY